MSPFAVCKNPEVLRPEVTEPDPLLSAHAWLLAVLGSEPPRPLPLCVADSDVEERGRYLRELLGVVWAYVGALLGDVAQNVPRDLDLRQIEALCCDLTSEVAGTVNLASAALPGRRL